MVTACTAFSDSIAAIKSGAAFAKTTISTLNITDITSSLPPGLVTSINATNASVGAALTKATSTMGRDLSIAVSSMELQKKFSFETTGALPTTAEQNTQTGPLGILQHAPDFLKNSANDIATSVAGMAANFGVTGAVGSITDQAKNVGAAITAFVTTIPVATIPDPANPPATMANPAYTTWASNPANLVKVAHMNDLTATLGAHSAAMSLGFENIASAASSALASGVSNLKAFALTSKLAMPSLPAGFRDAVTNGFDFNMIDPVCMKQTNAAIAEIKP